MRTTRILLTALAVTAIALISCRGSRQAATQPSNTPVVSHSLDASSVAANLVKSQKDWTDVRLPVSIKLIRPVSASVNATVYMRRGEYAKFSVRMLGFEVASVWIDTDSVRTVDKVGKRYVSENISKVTTELGIDISDVQDILLGRLFKVGGGKVEADGFSAEPTEYDGMRLLRPIPQPEALEYGFMVSGSEAPLLSYLLVDAGRFSAVAQYSDHDITPAGTLARRVAISSAEPRDISAELTWNLGSAKWDKGDRQKWQTPGNGYTRISLKSLLPILKKL